MNQSDKSWEELYNTVFESKYYSLMRSKLGLDSSRDRNREREDNKVVDDLLRVMKSEKVDYHNLFRAFGQYTVNKDQDFLVLKFFKSRQNQEMFKNWLGDYDRVLESSGERSESGEERKERMNRVNPKFVARNYLMQVAIEKAQQKDFREVQRLFEVLSHPFDEQLENEDYAKDPPLWAQSIELSCSS
eukprot:TRINITY_DN9779_c0_g1_i1.p1 TRINITY_DN9779_c0_g1~~TRINITY_DN9779_c0_g1_i1.p1  ORF type:complete len:188 (-),score=44.75 TRINITY_DN9779_c0_g1_i1:23-586(-)